MKPTILIVDDSPSVHQLVASHFAGEPWHICSAYTGSQGLSMAAERGAELVLLDVDLPDMNGFDVCRHLRRASPTSAVLFLTASASVDEKVCGLHVGGVDYVTKPFEPAELAERVRRSLRVNRLLELIPESAARAGSDRPAARPPVARGRRRTRRD